MASGYYTPHEEECPHSHKLYYRKAEWQWTCFECWKKWKQEQGDWNESAYQKGQQRKAGGSSHSYRYGFDRGFDPFNSYKGTDSRQQTPPPRSEARTTVDGLDATMVRRLIQLCHPDKHAGSEAATLATLWLLKLKEKMR
jgi:hypothetical protein